MKILFENTDILLRKDGHYCVINKGYLAIDGKYISYIGKEKPNDSFDLVKDFSNKLLMPGLINAHTHSPMVFLRGLGEGLKLDKWLNDYIFPTEAKMTPEIISAASYYAILELLASGVTSFTDMYFYPEETAEAVRRSGIKANLTKYITCFDEHQKVEDSEIPGSIKFYEEWNDKCDGRIKIDFGIHAEYTNKKYIVREYSRMCKKRNARMHIHLSETENEVERCKEKYGLTPVKWFENLGTFDNPTSAVHVVWPEGDDLQILKNHDVTVIHNPSSNMTLGSGFAPISKMLNMGINVALGTDGAASNNNLNMFEEMHMCSMLSNGFHLDPQRLSCESVLDMATINGAKSQGRQDTGILEVGMCADIIALNMKSIHLFPTLNYPALLCKSAQAGDVYMTMVDGKILYEDGMYFTLDRTRIIEDFKDLVNKFYNKDKKQ